MIPRKIDVLRFLKEAEDIPVIDVRSPGEYNRGHIPGSFNIPLFSDRERESVGIKYKKEGRIAAILEGLGYSGPSMTAKLKKALETGKGGKLLVYCWRGGMRSETMTWLFSLGDLECEILEGGYKAYRKHILSSLSEKRRMIILGGMTGSSKTHILRYLKEEGHQVIDLEGLACHKGSAFGSLGQPPQPSSEQFANLLYIEWQKMNRDKPVWLEDESRNIGSVFIPDGFYLNMQEAHAIILMMDVVTRLPRLTEEYLTYPAEILKESIMKISKRLGGDRTSEAISAVDSGDLVKGVEIALAYYDKAYMYGLKKKNSEKVRYIETDRDDIKYNAARILEEADNITW